MVVLVVERRWMGTSGWRDGGCGEMVGGVVGWRVFGWRAGGLCFGMEEVWEIR